VSNVDRNPWEGVNLLPFIDIQLLKDTIAAYCPDSKLSPDERRRNSLGDVVCYRYDAACTDTVPVPVPKIGLSEIPGCLSSRKVIGNQLSRGVPFKAELVKGTVLPYPGFPTLNVLPIASIELARVGLNCFGGASKYPNMILSLHRMPELPPLEVLAQNVLGRSVFVNWPMMHESRVVAISNEQLEIRLEKGQNTVKRLKDQEADRWLSESEAMVQTYHVGNGTPGSGGIVIGDVKVRLKVLPLQGMKTNPSNGSRSKVFGRQEADVPLQLALLQAPAPDPRFIVRGPLTLHERFPVDSAVVLTKGKYRGCRGVVAGVADDRNVAVKVQTLPAESPFGLAIARSVQESYISSADAARTLKIDGRVFGKITGRLQFEQDKYDLGLNLKAANGTCVVGYTRKKVFHGNGDKKPNKWLAGDSLLVIGSSGADADDDSDERIVWEYTPKAIRLIDLYRQTFPQLFSALKRMPDEKRYDANKVFGPNGKDWLPLIRMWLDNHETAKIPRTPISTESMSYEAISAVQKAAGVRALALKKAGYPKESLIKIPGNALYREGSTGATDVLLASDLNNNDAPRLGDRVVNLCADGVPFGAHGTVVAVHEAATTGSVEVVMDDEFVGGNTLQGACSNFRGKLCLWAHLLKVEPDNANRLVDKMVPKGSGQAAVKKILASMEQHVDQAVAGEPAAKASFAATKAVTDSAVAGKAKVVTTKAVSSASAPKAPSPKKSTSAASSAVQTAPLSLLKSPARAESTGRDRAASTGRGKQGAWKEAVGPPKDGVGFQGEGTMLNGKSGLSRWTALVQSSKMDSQLKSMLGVSPSSASDAATGLKAILGVVPNTTAAQPDLTRPPTAAEKLLQIMSSKQQHSGQHAAGRAPTNGPTSGFNFTYVNEGEEAKSAAPSVSMSLQPGINPIAGFAAGMLPPPMHVLAYGAPVMPRQGYGLPPTVNVHVNGATDQFPPLGAPKVTAATALELPRESVPAQTLPSAFSMVPSVVTGKR
jgi:hypothetical protein